LHFSSEFRFDSKEKSGVLCKGLSFDWYNFLYSILLLFVLLIVMFFDIKILSLEILIILIIFCILLEQFYIVNLYFQSKKDFGPYFRSKVIKILKIVRLKYIIRIINVYILMWILDLNLIEFIEYNWWLIIIYFIYSEIL